MVAAGPGKFEATDPARGWRGCEFVLSAPGVTHLPRDSECEVAVAGRSNAGKSSVINTLCGNSRLARISKTPGRTQALNCFRLAPGRYLIDLPGYGYAKVAQTQREHWDRELGRFFAARETLRGLLLVLDIRRGLTSLDWGLIELLDPGRTALHCLLNKADKLSRNQARQALRQIEGELRAHGVAAGVQCFSAARGDGMAQCCELLGGWFGLGAPT